MSFLVTLPIFLPVLTGVLLLSLNIKSKGLIFAYSNTVLTITTLLTLVSNFILMNEGATIFKLPLGMEFTIYIDAVAAFFSTIFSVIWLLVGIYTMDYLKNDIDVKRYIGFYLIVLGFLIGVAYADNLFTMYLCFELMSLTSFMLVAHNQTPEAISGARRYIYYSIFGAFIGLAGIFYFYSMIPAGESGFLAGGILPATASASAPMIILITFIALIGFSGKSGMAPLNGWLPKAHPVAPAPASAVLSGILTKSGIVVLIRIIFFVVGADTIKGTWAQSTMLLIAMATIFMGSMMAFKEKGLKKRLAYSSISQLSYVIFGIMLLTPLGVTAALLQVVFHALAKNVLFLTTGAIIHKNHIDRYDQLQDMKYYMPKTFALFTVAALSLVGVPFTAGFISKYYLVQASLGGASEFISYIYTGVLMLSALLTGGYLLSISAKGLFPNVNKEKITQDVSQYMLLPILLMVVAIVVFGIFPQPVINFATIISSSLGL